MLIKTLAAIAAGTVLATSAFAQSAKDIRGASPVRGHRDQSAPKLIVDPPLPDQLALGRHPYSISGRDVRIVPVFGTSAINVLATDRASAHHR